MLRAKFGACLPNRKIHRSSIRHGIPLQIRKVSAGGASLRAERTTLRTIAAKTMSNRSPFFCRAQGTPSRPPKICRNHLGSRLSSRRFRPGTQIRVVDAVEDFGPVTEDAAASWPDPVICGDRRARVRQELDLNLMNAPRVWGGGGQPPGGPQLGPTGAHVTVAAVTPPSEHAGTAGPCRSHGMIIKFWPRARPGVRPRRHCQLVPGPAAGTVTLGDIRALIDSSTVAVPVTTFPRVTITVRGTVMAPGPGSP